MGDYNYAVPHLIRRGKDFYWRPTAEFRALGFKAEALGSDPKKAVARAKELTRQASLKRPPPSRRDSGRQQIGGVREELWRAEDSAVISPAEYDELREGIMEGRLKHQERSIDWLLSRAETYKEELQRSDQGHVGRLSRRQRELLEAVENCYEAFHCGPITREDIVTEKHTKRVVEQLFQKRRRTRDGGGNG